MFSVTINEDEVFPVIRLLNSDENTFADVFTFGALLNCFCVNNSVNIIDGFSSAQNAKNNITKSFKSAKLSPFVCRVKDGKYMFKETEYTLHKFYWNNEALHGLLYDALFTVNASGADEDNAFVKLQYIYQKEDNGFPFNYSCAVTYSLKKNNQLKLTTVVTNDSNTSIPVCDGWHPYFTLNEKIDDLLFKINSDKLLEFNDKLMPTGNIINYEKFQQPERLADAILDNCFLLNNNEEACCILQSKKNNLQLTIHADDSYKWLQVFTPDHRNSIAIENLSAAPNAFNNKTGLIILHTGKSKTFSTTYSVEIFK